MTTLNLGVLDVAYSDADGETTTWQVAEFLESDYHVMRVFYEVYEEKIQKILLDQSEKELRNIQNGKPVNLAALNLEKVEELFRDFLDSREWEKISSQLIVAALLGKSSSKKEQNKARASRPAFIDTGLYQASFRSWVE